MGRKENLNIASHYIEIPPIFQSDLTGKPMDKCVTCECDLLKDGVMYLIEKAFRAYPGTSVRSTIFEYAICFNCYLQMQGDLSKESMQRLGEYFDKNLKIDWEDRARKLTSQGNLSVDPWLESCILTGSKMSEISEYQIYGQCDGKHLLYHTAPYMMSGKAVDEMVDLLSNKTLDELERFGDQITSPDPELEELTRRPVVFV